MEEPQTKMTYIRLLNQALALYKEERYQDAIELINQYGHLVDGNLAQIYSFLFSLAARAGRNNLALGLMQEAIEKKGLWYSVDYLRTDDDLEPLRRFGMFEQFVEICEGREKEAKLNARPELRLLSEGGDSLIVALHGNQDSNDINEPYWRCAASFGGVVALAQSSVESFSGAYTWNDTEKGAAELEQHLLSLSDRFSVPPARTVLAGFSAGCNVIMRAVLDGKVEAGSLLLVGPWLPMLDEWAPRLGMLNGMKVRIIIGDRDEDCLEGAMKLDSLLRDLGVEHEMRVIEGMDHDYPDDLCDDIAAALRK